MSAILSKYFFYYFTLSALVRFVLVLIFSSQQPARTSERKVRVMIMCGIILDAVHLLALLVLHSLLQNIEIKDFLYFSITFNVIWNGYSLMFLCFSIGLLALIARFSSFYLHRDKYFFKFFALLYIFELSICFLVLTVSTESIFIGWELMGLSSVLLIAFYEHRISVLKNAMSILVIYKISDVIFYSSLIYSAYSGSHSYIDNANTLTLICVLAACLIKSSIFPFIWLPRAMEGPTPSSAMFYGGISTHLALYVFLSVWSHAEYHNSYLVWIAIGLIFLSACVSSLMSKQAPDAKNAIAYASIAQLGLMYIETLLGFYTLALIHAILNGVYRAAEFLHSPSLLYKYHSIEQARQNGIKHNAFHIESYLSVSLRKKIYFLMYHEFILPRAWMSSIQWFLGFHTARLSAKSTLLYLYVSLFAFIALESILYILLKFHISPFDEFMLLIALAFNAVAIVNKYRPFNFFIAMISSISAIFIVLLAHTSLSVPGLHHLLYAAAMYFIGDFGYRKIGNQPYIGVPPTEKKSEIVSLTVLLTGISLIGIPGLASFVLWEHLEHALVMFAPDLIIDGFFIMTLNTIIFFRFYFSNFLGSHCHHNMHILVNRE